MPHPPMKVALFLHSLAGGGAERIMVTLANAFAERGHAVDMVLAQATGPYLGDLSGEVRLVDLGVPRFLKSLWPLAGYLGRERPHAMLSALDYVNVLAVAARGLSRAPTRLLVSEHNVIGSGGFRSRRGKATLRLMRMTYPRADQVIAVSEGVADELVDAVGLPRARIDVVHNPVVTPDLLRRAAQDVDLAWFGEDRPPVILGVGRLTEQKDFATLVRAFAHLRERRACRLAILGEGELRGEIEALARALGVADDVLMPGFVANPYPWMRNAAAFVLSSRWEGLPTVLIEAMACGTRVVSTDCPSGPREILQDGAVGPLAPVGDPVALAEAIDRALRSPPTRAALERAQFFSVDRAAARYLELLQPPAPRRQAGPGPER